MHASIHSHLFEIMENNARWTLQTATLDVPLPDQR